MDTALPSTSTSPRAFPVTPWTRLGLGESAATLPDEVLGDLCQMYWYPLFAYARRRGFGPEDAEDLTQDFFRRLLVRKDLQHVDRKLGKLRSFLLCSMQNFLTNEHRRNSTQRRGGHVKILSFDLDEAEERFQEEGSSEASPEQQYDRRWALTLLETVLDQLEDEFAAAGKERQFEALSPFLSVQGGSETHAEAASRIGMSDAAVKVALFRMRKRYKALLKRQVAATLANGADVEEEIRSLLRIFHRS